MEIEAYCPVLRGRLDDPTVGEIAKNVSDSRLFRDACLSLLVDL